MSVIPDFGYDGDNFLLEKSEAPRNWKLLTDLIYNKDKYEWLRNHMELRKIRRLQQEHDEQKKHQNSKNKLL